MSLNVEKNPALSRVNSKGQRSFFARVILRPFTLGLMASFLAGVALIGWLDDGPHSQQPAQRSAYIIQVPNGTPPASKQYAQAEVLDFRGVGHGTSSYPRPLSVAAAMVPADQAGESVQQMEELAPAMAQVAPAAGLGADVKQALVDEVKPAVAAAPQSSARQAMQSAPRIAIVIDDIGPNYRESLAAIALPKEITLSFLPYAEQLATLTSRARAAGHEMLVHMPMEPEDLAHNNPGPDALLISLTPEQIRARVDAALDSFKGHVGLNNHMGSRFTADMAALKPVLEELAKRNEFFFNSRTTPQSTGVELATQLGMPFVGRDVFLDNDIDVEQIKAQLNTLERLARAQGHASAIGHPYAQTIEALKEWIPEAQARGVQLVRLSTLVQHLGVSQVSAPVSAR